MADDVSPPTPAPIRSYYVWVTAPEAEFAEDFVTKLVKRGFTVAALGRRLITHYDDNPGSVVAVSVYRVPRDDQERKEWTPLGLYNEACDVLKQVNAKYWSIVVAQQSEATWCTGNISLKAEQERVKAELKRYN